MTIIPQTGSFSTASPAPSSPSLAESARRYTARAVGGVAFYVVRLSTAVPSSDGQRFLMHDIARPAATIRTPGKTPNPDQPSAPLSTFDHIAPTDSVRCCATTRSIPAVLACVVALAAATPAPPRRRHRSLYRQPCTVTGANHHAARRARLRHRRYWCSRRAP
ncbi:MAG: hypothetical protein U1F09_16255 [Steroidobacteraceae bacterium]